MSWRGGQWVKLGRRISAQHQALWVFSDQGLVSASNFILGVLMARLLGVEGFGQWVLLWAIVLYANTICTAVILAPLLTELPRAETDADRQRLLRGSLTVQVLLSVALVSILVLGVWLADHVLHRWSVGTMVWPMAAAMVAYQLQEWARRCFFAQRTAKPVLGSDLLAYGGQLLLILGLGWAGRLTMTSAFLSMAVCYGLGFAVSMAQLRVKPSMTAARWVASSMWRTSRDYLLSGQFQWIGASGVLFVGAGALGVQSAAAIRTVQNLLGPTNILFQALENLAPVQCSHRFKSGGVAALSSYLRKLMLVFGGPLAVFLLGIALMGTELLTAAYGQAYSAFGHLVALQCGYVFLSFAVRLLMFRRRALDQVQVISLASLLSAIVSVASVAVLARPFQDVGVLGGMLGGLAASLLVLWRWPASRRATAAN